MSRKYLIFLLISIMSSTGLVAQYYSKVFNSPDTSRIGRGVAIFGEDVLVRIGTLCDPDARECGHILRLDANGDLVWRSIIDEFDFGNDNTLLVRDNTIYLSGYKTRVSENPNFGRLRLDANGEKLNFSYSDIIEAKQTINYGSQLLANNQWLQYGYYEKEDEKSRIILIYSDSLGNEAMVKDYYQGNLVHNIFDITERDDASLVFISEIDTPENILSEHIYRIEVINADNELETLYETDPISRQIGWALDMIAAGDGYIFTIPNELDRATADYLKVDLQGDIIWTYHLQSELYPNFLDHRELFHCANGDILVCGRLGIRVDDLLIERSGIITRLSPDGEVLWHKMYTHEDTVTGEFRESSLIDIVEDDSGNIIATGLVRNFYNGVRVSDTWIMKVDENGCFGDNDDCGIVITDVDEIPREKSQSTLYPNPTSGFISSRLPIQQYSIHNITGQRVACHFGSGPVQKIDLSVLDSGIYFITLQDQDDNWWTEKLVVER